MAKGTKTGGRNIKPGQVLNPIGGRAHSPEKKALKKLTTEHLKEVADIILEGNLEKLKALVTDPNTSVLKVWIAKAAATAIQKGDINTLETILNRSIGKVKEKVDLSSDGFKVIIEEYGKK